MGAVVSIMSENTWKRVKAGHLITESQCGVLTMVPVCSTGQKLRFL